MRVGVQGEMLGDKGFQCPDLLHGACWDGQWARVTCAQATPSSPPGAPRGPRPGKRVVQQGPCRRSGPGTFSQAAMRRGGAGRRARRCQS